VSKIPIEHAIDDVIERDVVMYGDPLANKTPPDPRRPKPWIPLWPWVFVFVFVFIGGGLIGFWYPWFPQPTPDATNPAPLTCRPMPGGPAAEPGRSEPVAYTQP